MCYNEYTVSAFYIISSGGVILDYSVNSGVWGNMFGVPHIVADNFLKLATGSQIKVLLYLLRCSGRPCTDEEIASASGVPVSEVADAVLFWTQANVLSDGTVNSSAVPKSIFSEPQPQSAPVQPSALPVNAPVPTPEKSSANRRSTSLRSTEIVKLMNDSKELSDLFRTAEACLGTLTNAQQSSLIHMYTYLGLKSEVIITLLYYCVSIEKKDFRYIERIAEEWSEKEINTLDAAQKEAARLKSSREFTAQIMRIFEMDRRPTSNQAAFISDWKEKNIPAELIRCAYERCVENTNKLSFPYINKVLMSWHDEGITTISGVKAAEDSYKNRKTASDDKGEFDVDMYKSLINKF